MEEPKNDENVEKIRDLVTIDIEHELSDTELKEIAVRLAALYGEIEQAEERKKNVVAQHKNAIDALKVEVKTLSSHYNTGFRSEPRVAELFLDYKIQKRMYYDKRTGDFLLEKSFQEEDYQRKINYFAKQEQIEYNNEIGDFAEQLPEPPPFPGSPETGDDALAKVINEKKKGGSKEKPTPKDNLPPNHGANLEYQEDHLPPEDDGLGVDRNGNPTDIKSDMVDPDLFAKADGDLPNE